VAVDKIMADSNVIVADDPVFDLTEALAIVDGDHELFQEIAQTFVESCPAELSAIREALERADAVGVRAAAHHLKGSLSALAARPAAESARQLELMGRSADLTGADALYEGLHRQTLALAAELRRMT
jgi:HPt (histidine-containing phosphotransfer) domain-containing protein